MIANCISILRLLLGLLVLFVLPVMSFSTINLLLLLLVMTLAEISDICDGYVARRLDQVSDVGKLLDPLVDSFYRFFVFLGFVGVGWMSFWMLSVFFANYMLTAYLRSFAGSYGVSFRAARLSGKVKSFIQGLVQLTVVMFYILVEEAIIDKDIFITLKDICIYIALMVTVLATIDYIYYFVNLILGRVKEV